MKRVEVVRECVGALVSGDVKAALALCSPDVEVEESPRWPDRKTYRGREGAMRAYETMLDAFEDVRFEAEGFTEIGDQVVASIKVHGRGRESGVETEARIAYLTPFTLAELPGFGSLTIGARQKRLPSRKCVRRQGGNI